MKSEDFHIGAGSLSFGGTDVGATTQEGVIVTYEPDVHFHMSGKYGSTPVKASLVGQKLTIQATMAETTKANLEALFAGVSGDTTKAKFGGVAGREIVGKELMLTPFDGTQKWVFRNAVPTSTIQVAYQPNNDRVYQVTFTALVDEDAPEAENIAFVS
jgi:hypothetical protein